MWSQRMLVLLKNLNFNETLIASSAETVASPQVDEFHAADVIVINCCDDLLVQMFIVLW
jgi:hypothetical protein